LIEGDVFEQDRKEIDKAIVAARAAFRDAMGTRTLDCQWVVTFGPLADHPAADACRARSYFDRHPLKEPTE
jgi:hypothetical protein